MSGPNTSFDPKQVAALSEEAVAAMVAEALAASAAVVGAETACMVVLSSRPNANM